MTTKMTTGERDAFLADVRVGILSIGDGERGPLAVPVWYGYEPDGKIWFVTSPTSMKGKLLDKATRISITAQTEAMPYAYVMAEGPFSVAPADMETHERPLAHRYLGPETGDAYIAANGGGENILVTLTPERWLSVDYGKVDVLAGA